MKGRRKVKWGVDRPKERGRGECDLPFQVPIDVAVEEPWAGVVSVESNRDVIAYARVADAHDVAHDRVVIVVKRGTCTPNHVECVPMQVDRVLCCARALYDAVRNPQLGMPVAELRLTGPPRAPAGMLISTLLCASRP